MEHNVAEDRAAAAEMIRLSGQRGVPVIVVDGHVVVGFDREALEKLLARPELGLSITSAAEYGRQRGLPLPQGAYVGAVRPGSVGDQAGLAAGDVITAVDDRPVRSDRDLEVLLPTLQGRRVLVHYSRSGEARTAELAL